MTLSTYRKPHAIGSRVVATDSHYPAHQGKTGTVEAFDLRSCCPYVVRMDDGTLLHFNDGEIADA